MASFPCSFMTSYSQLHIGKLIFCWSMCFMCFMCFLLHEIHVVPTHMTLFAIGLYSVQV